MELKFSLTWRLSAR